MEEFKLLTNPSQDEVIEADRFWDAFFLLSPKSVLTNSVDKENQDLYPNLEPEALLTSYQDYFKILSDLPTGSVLCDLGAGYGRGSFLSYKLGLSKCYSVELSKERIDSSMEAARKLDYPLDLFIHADIKNLDLAHFDHFYLYFPKTPLILDLLKRLWNQSSDRPTYLYVTESHGDMIPFLNELSFLKIQASWKTALPRHYNEVIKYEVLGRSPCHLAEELVTERGEEVYLSHSYHHLILNRPVDWIFSANETDLHFEGKWKVEFCPFSRKINLDQVKRIKISENERKLIDLEGKLLKSDIGYFIEDRSGRVNKLS